MQQCDLLKNEKWEQKTFCISRRDKQCPARYQQAHCIYATRAIPL